MTRKASKIHTKISDNNCDNGGKNTLDLSNNTIEYFKPKNAYRKPAELERDCSLKDYEVWKRKYLDYSVLTYKLSLDKSEQAVQVATFRGFLT